MPICASPSDAQGMALLDLFFGLGISAGEAIRLGATHVACFEKPAHAAVRRFAAMLPCPSVVAASADDERVIHRLREVGVSFFATPKKLAEQRRLQLHKLSQLKAHTYWVRVHACAHKHTHAQVLGYSGTSAHMCMLTFTLYPPSL